jgi:hypothetical protein
MIMCVVVSPATIAIFQIQIAYRLTHCHILPKEIVLRIEPAEKFDAWQEGTDGIRRQSRTDFVGHSSFAVLLQRIHEL